MSAAKKAKTEPVFPDKIDGVDKPLLQTLATVCDKLYDEQLYAEFKPKDGAESNEMLDQLYELIKKGGEYTDAAGNVISGVSVFNYDTDLTASLAEFGEVIDGITDFHGEFQPASPPFAALIVQPKDDKAAPILILAWRGSVTAFDWINDAAGSHTLSTRWSGNTKDILAHGALVNLVENTFSRHEDAIVQLIEKHKVERAFFSTGHSLGGGLAINVAHIVVRGQLQKVFGLAGRPPAPPRYQYGRQTPQHGPDGSPLQLPFSYGQPPPYPPYDGDLRQPYGGGYGGGGTGVCDPEADETVLQERQRKACEAYARRKGAARMSPVQGGEEAEAEHPGGEGELPRPVPSTCQLSASRAASRALSTTAVPQRSVQARQQLWQPAPTKPRPRT